MKKYTISILSYTEVERAKRCVESVLKHSKDFVLFLTANGPIPVEYFRSVAFDNSIPSSRGVVHVIENKNNEGFIGPNNHAFSLCQTPYFVLLNDDFEVSEGWLEKLEEPFLNPRAALSGPRGACQSLRKNLDGYPGGPFEYLEGSCLMVKVDTIRAHFKTLFSTYLCLHPMTPVLTADLQWVPIEQIAVGDELICVDEFSPAKKGSCRKYQKGVVEATARRNVPCLEITLNDGRSVICSSDHSWLSKKNCNNGMKYVWRKANELVPGFRISTPFRVWGTDTSFDAGWLSGILDGEGYVRKGGRKSDFNAVGTSIGVAISQQEGPVLQRARDILRQMGIPTTEHKNSKHHKIPVINLMVNIRKFGMEILGRLRPTRLLPRAHILWEHRALRSRNAADAQAIAAVRYIGNMEVITLQTSAGTFIANGMVSKNCQIYGEDSDLSLRMRRLGFTIHQVDFPHKHARQATTRKMPDVRAQQLRNQAEVRKRFVHYLKVRRFDYPIVVRRAGAVGDVILTTAIVRAIHKENPLCPISVQTKHPEVYLNNPDISHASPTPVALRNHDCLLVNLDMAYENRPRTNIMDAYAAVAGVQGPWNLAIHTQESDSHFAESLFTESVFSQNAKPEKRWCAIHVGPSWPGKSWSVQGWLHLLAYLRAHDYRIIHVGGVGVGVLDGDVDLRGKTTIQQLAEVLFRCNLFVGIDSMPMHVANIMDTPAVALFGVSLPEYVLPNNGSCSVLPVVADRNHRSTGLRHKLRGRTFVDCGQNNPMDTITPEMVITAVETLGLT